MTLINTTVTITITIPKIELENGGLSLDAAREILHDCALEQLDGAGVISSKHEAQIRIIDCPSYPALNE